MNMYQKTFYTSMAAVLITALSACGSISKKIDDHEFLMDRSGLVLDESAAPTLLYVRPNAPSLGSYNSFIVDPVHVIYSDPKIQKIAAEDLLRMQRYFRERVAAELVDAGYTVTEQAGEATMRLTFALSGMAAPSAKANIIGALAPIAISVGEVTVEAGFSESTSYRIDAIAVHRSQGSRLLNAKPWSTWADVEVAFDEWAIGITKGVKQAHAVKR